MGPEAGLQITKLRTYGLCYGRRKLVDKLLRQFVELRLAAICLGSVINELNLHSVHGLDRPDPGPVKEDQNWSNSQITATSWAGQPCTRRGPASGCPGGGLLPPLTAVVELREVFCFKLSVKSLIEFSRLK